VTKIKKEFFCGHFHNTSEVKFVRFLYLMGLISLVFKTYDEFLEQKSFDDKNNKTSNF
jgi:hypothetical protein